MILKTCLVAVLSVIWARNISGASFSKVFVQTGAEGTPALEYVQYGVPPIAYGSPQIAQLNAAPYGSVLPLPSIYSYGAPCGSACFYPGQSIAAVAPVETSANLVAYKSPISSVPLSYTPSAPAGYEYSYIVYDTSTGDQKVHGELSDGSVVRGEYSFLQPDGLVRDVKYVADDATGFNAIVKNFLPVGETKYTETANSPPNNEVKSEPLKALETRESHDENHEEHLEPNEIPNRDHHEDNKPHEEHYETYIEAQDPEHQELNKELEVLHRGIEVEISVVEKLQEQPHAVSEEQKKAETEKLEEPTETPEKEPEVVTHQNLEVQSLTEENHIEEVPETVEEQQKESNETTIAQSEEPLASHEAASVENAVIDSNMFISYNDILKCIQAAISKIRESPDAHKQESPITYLLFNKPC